jgi:hypothetical protein
MRMVDGAGDVGVDGMLLSISLSDVEMAGGDSAPAMANRPVLCILTRLT